MMFCFEWIPGLVVNSQNDDVVWQDSACTDVLHISGHARRLTQQKGSYTTCEYHKSIVLNANLTIFNKEFIILYAKFIILNDALVDDFRLQNDDFLMENDE